MIGNDLMSSIGIAAGIAVIATALSVSDYSYAAPPPPPLGNVWAPNYALSDEFNGTSLNTTKWRPNHAWWVGRPPSTYVPANVSEGGGTLQLVNTVIPDSQRRPGITIGAPCVSSINPIVGFGYYEARIKASPSSMSSAFYFQRKDGEEIDVAENFGGSKTSPQFTFESHTNTHYFPNGYKPQNDTHSIAKLSTPNTDWHIYGIWYQNSNQAQIYIDGALVSTHIFKGPLDRPMYMFFESEPSEAQGIPSAAELQNSDKNTMMVDWIRSYTLKAQ
jgi:hypothetical protein